MALAKTRTPSSAKTFFNRSSSTFYFHFLDDGPELVHLALENRVLLGRRRAGGLRPDVGEAFRHLGMAHRGGHFLLQPLDHFARRARRREEPVPAVRLEHRVTEL